MKGWQAVAAVPLIIAQTVLDKLWDAVAGEPDAPPYFSTTTR